MTTPPSPEMTGLRRHTSLYILLAFIVLAVVRVMATYPHFTQTGDEPSHIAAGMQWLDRGVFLYEPKHPPLARVAFALGPYLDGIRSFGEASYWTEGNEILHSGGNYYRNLALARLGNLPFLVIAAISTYAWGVMVSGRVLGVVAAGMFLLLPPILAHTGIATTDMAIAAMLPLSTLLWLRWLVQPSLGRGIALGIGIALTLIAKMSAILFLPLSFVITFGAWWWTADRGMRLSILSTINWREFVLQRCFPVMLALFFTIWAGYRFSVGPISGVEERPHIAIDKAFGSTGSKHDFAYRLIELPIPAHEFLLGIKELFEHNASGRRTFLLGEVRQTGWWYFFPVAIGVKTPIAFLLAAVFGAYSIIWKKRDDRNSDFDEPIHASAAVLMLLIPLALILIVLPGNLNVGLRHLLAIYPFLSVAAGIGVIALWNLAGQRTIGRSAAVVCVGSLIFSSAQAHPNYLTYFNVFAGSSPEHVLVLTDFEWGQDYGKLADALRSQGVRRVAFSPTNQIPVKYLKKLGFPDVVPLNAGESVDGWIALDAGAREMGSAHDALPTDAFAWLDRFPYIQVGKTIRLYYVPGPHAAESGPAPTEKPSR